MYNSLSNPKTGSHDYDRQGRECDGEGIELWASIFGGVGW